MNMELIAYLGLWFFVLYTPIFFIFLFIAVQKYKNYSIILLWMSNLGDNRYESYKIFKSAWIIYSLSCLFMVYGLFTILPKTTYSIWAVFLLLLSVAFSIITNLIPVNVDLVRHHLYSLVVTISINLSFLLLTIIIYSSNLLPKYLVTTNIAVIAISVIFAVSFIKLITKMKKIPLSLTELEKEKTSFLIRNATVLEWLYIISVIVNSYIYGLIALRRF